MSVKNFYPELPVIPYQRTTVSMAEVIVYLQSLTISAEVKRIAYVVFRNESSNGKSGVNNNYAGIQADGARWGAIFDEKIIATCVLKENNGRIRRFVCFSSWKDSVDMTINRMQSRGIYVGGYAKKYAKMRCNTVDELVRVYYKEWVRGDASAEPGPIAIENFKSLYNQAIQYFK